MQRKPIGPILINLFLANRGFVAVASLVVFCSAAGTVWAQPAIGPPVFAGIFGSRNLTVENPNNPGTNYTMVHHEANSVAAHDALAYDAARGWGFEIISPGDPDRNAAEQYGPFDDSPNNRNEFDDGLPDQLYDSFIGFKNFTDACNPSVTGGVDVPCAPSIPAEGGVFRIDVPNGQYRFVGVFGSPDNGHTSRVLVQDGGSGPPADGAGAHVVLVHNHDQSKLDAPGRFARVGFLDKRSPEPIGATLPTFYNMDANGMPAGGDGSGTAESPVLNVSSGHIRLHLLQGNSDGGDPNGGNVVLFEVYPVGGEFILGDVNGDLMVDILDYEIIRDNLNQSPAGLSDGDINFDGRVDLKDFRIWKTEFNNAGAAIPEPASLGLLMFSAGILSIWIRKRHATD